MKRCRCVRLSNIRRPNSTRALSSSSSPSVAAATTATAPAHSNLQPLTPLHADSTNRNVHGTTADDFEEPLSSPSPPPPAAATPAPKFESPRRRAEFSSAAAWVRRRSQRARAAAVDACRTTDVFACLSSGRRRHGPNALSSCHTADAALGARRVADGLSDASAVETARSSAPPLPPLPTPPPPPPPPPPAPPLPSSHSSPYPSAASPPPYQKLEREPLPDRTFDESFSQDLLLEQQQSQRQQQQPPPTPPSLESCLRAIAVRCAAVDSIADQDRSGGSSSSRSSSISGSRSEGGDCSIWAGDVDHLATAIADARRELARATAALQAAQRACAACSFPTPQPPPRPGPGPGHHHHQLPLWASSDFPPSDDAWRDGGGCEDLSFILAGATAPPGTVTPAAAACMVRCLTGAEVAALLGWVSRHLRAAAAALTCAATAIIGGGDGSRRATISSTTAVAAAAAVVADDASTTAASTDTPRACYSATQPPAETLTPAALRRVRAAAAHSLLLAAGELRAAVGGVLALLTAHTLSSGLVLGGSGSATEARVAADVAALVRCALAAIDRAAASGAAAPGPGATPVGGPEEEEEDGEGREGRWGAMAARRGALEAACLTPEDLCRLLQAHKEVPDTDATVQLLLECLRHNRRLRTDGCGEPPALGTAAEAEAEAAAATELLRSEASADVRQTLLYVLAQHGRHAQVLALLSDWRTHTHTRAAESSNASSVSSPPSSPPQPSSFDKVNELLLCLAAVNAAPQTAAGSSRALNPTCADGGERSPPLHSSPSSFSSSSHAPAPLLELARRGLWPSRVPSMTEYAMLVKHFTAATSSPAAASASATPAARAGSGKAMHDWVFSPATVWHRTASAPVSVRAALCLLGFQVRMRHLPGGAPSPSFSPSSSSSSSSLSPTLAWEDLYVVLCVTRRELQRQEAALARWRCLLPSGGACARPANPPAFPASDATEGDSGGVAGGDRFGDDCGDLADDDDSEAAALARDEALALCGPLPLFLLPARRHSAPAGAAHLAALCAAYVAAHRRAQGPAAPPSSAVLRALTAAEMQRTLGAAAALPDAVAGAAAAAAVGCEGETPAAPRPLPDCVWEAALISAAEQPSPPQPLLLRQAAVLERVAEALRRRVEAGDAGAVRPLVETCVALPSPFAVAAQLSGAVRRRLGWRECLRLLPCVPLGSGCQAELLRRVLQHGEGRRAAAEGHCAALRGVPASVAAVARAAERQHSRELSRRGGLQQQQRQRPPATRHCHPGVALPPAWEPLSAQATEMTAGEQPIPRPPSTTAATAATAAAGPPPLPSIAAQEQQTVAILLQPGWAAALEAFHAAPPRVQAGSAPQLVRLLIESGDGWRSVHGGVRRSLVRLALLPATTADAEGAAGNGSGGGGGSGGSGSALVEAMLGAELAAGRWRQGLALHRLLRREHPETLRRSPRAGLYAALLGRGLLERTALAHTFARMTQAARAGRWREAALCFLRHAARESVGSDGGGVDRRTADTATAATTVGGSSPVAVTASASAALLLRAAAQYRHPSAGGREERERTEQREQTRAAAAARVLFEYELPAELPHVANLARYAFLQTPELWRQALRWFPEAVFPLPPAHALEAARRHGAGWRGDLPPPPSLSSSSSSLPALPDSPGTAAAPAAPAYADVDVLETARRERGKVHRASHAEVTATQAAVLSALQALRRQPERWPEAVAVCEAAAARGCFPLAGAGVALHTMLDGGAGWAEVLARFSSLVAAAGGRPDTLATTAALRACAEGGLWRAALHLLRQSVLTAPRGPAPAVVELALQAAVRGGAWAEALRAADRFRHTRSPRVAHAVLATLMAAARSDDAVDFFYDCFVAGRGGAMRPLDATLALAALASERAGREHRQTAAVVGAVVSAVEDMFEMSGVLLEHVLFVHHRRRHRHSHRHRAAAGDGDDDDDTDDLYVPHALAPSSSSSSLSSPSCPSCPSSVSSAAFPPGWWTLAVAPGARQSAVVEPLTPPPTDSADHHHHSDRDGKWQENEHGGRHPSRFFHSQM